MNSDTILGMPSNVFTAIHVAISLVGVASGILVVLGMLGSKPLNILTMLFLITTLLTSVTGFFFPFHGVTPGIVIGVLSILLLLAAILARYSFHLAGPWRSTYVLCSVVALWFNVFILIVQMFEKVPALHALAPTQSEAPFKIAQLATLALFIALGVFAVKKFHVAPLSGVTADAIVP
jgi:hypothetical protein